MSYNIFDKVVHYCGIGAMGQIEFMHLSGHVWIWGTLAAVYYPLKLFSREDPDILYLHPLELPGIDKERYLSDGCIILTLKSALHESVLTIQDDDWIPYDSSLDGKT